VVQVVEDVHRGFHAAHGLIFSLPKLSTAKLPALSPNSNLQFDTSPELPTDPPPVLNTFRKGSEEEKFCAQKQLWQLHHARSTQPDACMPESPRCMGCKELFTSSNVPQLDHNHVTGYARVVEKPSPQKVPVQVPTSR
jgi:hypothetical protein